MKRLFDKDEVLFAVCWIVLYVVGFGSADAISETIGMPKAVTVCLGLVLSAALLAFIRRNGLREYYGLCGVKGGLESLLYLLPLAAVASINLWNGLTFQGDFFAALLYVVSMCFVGFLEEVIFRGLLFRGMCKTNVSTAILVSSLTFGMGHAVNLLMGAPVADTLLQLVYASAVGFLFTAVFHVGGSILPCIAAHILVNVSSIFAVEPGLGGRVVMALVQSVVAVVCGMWILRRGRAEELERK